MKKDFKRTPPFKSKLIPYQGEILAAWRDRKTLREIREMLAEKDVSISITALWSFIHCRLRRKDPHEIELAQSEAPAPTNGLPADFKEQLARIAAMDPVKLEREYALRKMKEQNDF